jgi:hypothetical protein
MRMLISFEAWTGALLRRLKVTQMPGTPSLCIVLDLDACERNVFRIPW